MDLALSASGVRKSFGSVDAVRGIDLQVPRGARFGLIGQNGAGKTTFIKMMLGICRHDAGEISVLGGAPEDVQVRRRIGYLPERLTIPPSFSALSFLDSVARLKGVASAQRESEAKELLQLVGLEEAAWKRKVGGYSKGMKQRTGLAAALIGKPELLVLDEPTDGIDPIGRRQIRDVILQVAKGGCTLFLNSHLLAETEKVCDHIAVLHRGAVVRQGALSTLQRTDRFRVRFAFAGQTPESVRDKAVAAGFVASDVGTNDASADIVDDAVVLRFVGTDAGAMNVCLGQAIAAGLTVVEVAPELVALETVLEEAMTSSTPQPPAA